MVGKKFQHIHLANYTCMVVAETNKGYKVIQTVGKKKPVTKYYDRQDFIGDRKFWQEITN